MPTDTLPEIPSSGRRASPRLVVREDYHKHTKISYAEAALIAGVKVSTIQGWVCGGKRNSHKTKGVLPLCAKRGPFRIDRMDLEKFLRRGLK